MKLRSDEIIFDEPEQFPLDEILNEKDRIARGWMTTEVRDKQGDLIPIEEFKRVMNTWMKRGAPINDKHTNKHVGKGLSWHEGKHPRTGKDGIILDYQIFDDYILDDKVWEEIKSHKRTGLSIGGIATQPSTYEKTAGQSTRRLAGLELYEVSSVDNPANQGSQNTHINYLAKSDVEASQYDQDARPSSGAWQQPTGDEGLIEMSYDDCITAQLKRGLTPMSAERVCNWLMSAPQEVTPILDESMTNDEGFPIGRMDSGEGETEFPIGTMDDQESDYPIGSMT